MRPRKDSFPTYIAILLAAAVVLVVSIIVFAWWNSSIRPINKDGYQLVKLTNGEMFFGKLQSTSGDYLRLENAYFIPSTANTTSSTTTTNETTLLSRKSTVAKSNSPMYIRADQVAYWENLASDGKVAQTLENANPK